MTLLAHPKLFTSVYLFGGKTGTHWTDVILYTISDYNTDSAYSTINTYNGVLTRLIGLYKTNMNIPSIDSSDICLFLDPPLLLSL